MAVRAKNSVDEKFVCRLLKAHNVTDDETKFSVSDLDVVAENYADFLKELATNCPRPTKLLLKGGLKLAFQGINPQKAELMAGRLSACCSYCRGKAFHSTSGVKLNAEVRAIGLLLMGKTDSCPGVQLGAGRLGRSLMTTARKLQRSKSDESAHSPKRARSSVSLSSPKRARSSLASSSSQRPHDSIDELRALYGLKSESSLSVKKAAMVQEGVIDLDDSEDDTAPVTAAPSFKVMTDYSSGKVYKMHPTGQRTYAVMKKGPGGFQIAVFSDPPCELETEVPNLLLEAQPQKIMKRPAAAPSKKKTPLAKLEEEVEEDAPVEEQVQAPGEEEDAEGEGEEEEACDDEDDEVPTVEYDE